MLSTALEILVDLLPVGAGRDGSTTPRQKLLLLALLLALVVALIAVDGHLS